MSLDVYLFEIVGIREPRESPLYSENITHNLAAMAKEAGCVDEVWSPEEKGITHAEQMIPVLENAIVKMALNRKQMEEHDAPNGWGTYENLLLFLQNYLAACKENPQALIRIRK
jgi:cobalamin biosynthesis protein CbiD